MRARPGLDLVIAGGGSIGLGHVMRSAVLAVEARRRGWRVRAFLEGDEKAAAQWRVASERTPCWRWADGASLDAAPLTLLDHPHEKTDQLLRLAGSDSRTIVLDDPRYRDEADLTILPGLHHPTHAASNASPRRVLSGPRFAILGRAHRSVRRLPLLARTRLLLSLGGSDPHHLTCRLAPLLSSVLEDSEVLHGIASWHVVLGPAFEDPGDRIQRSLEHAGWRVHRAIPALRMAILMSQSRIAVMGFGTSLTELAWHGTPHLSVTHRSGDDPSARFLESQGIGVHLGSAGSLDDETVRARFRCALEDARWQEESADRAFRAIEGGHGSRRILAELEKLHPAAEHSPSILPNPGATHVLSS